MSLKHRLAFFLMGLALAMPIWATPGTNLASQVVRAAAEPRSIAVNWNGFAAMFAAPEG
jgi:hypothetical protein